MSWVCTVAALVLGFLLKVLYDELRSPKLQISGVSRRPFQIEKIIKTVGVGVDNYYNAYRIKVENKEKRYLNCAAENCMAWIELDSAAETYQLCWVGNLAEVAINVGDVREVDICAQGTQTGEIIAPTERGYFEPSPRIIGNGTCELKGKLKITSKNGRRAETQITIKPTSNNQLEIILHQDSGK